MLTDIRWFSGTGNSLHVAKRLADTLEEAELHHIRPGSTLSQMPVAHLVVVFPVYAWGPPALVNRFIAGLPEHCAGRATVVATYGGAPGKATSMVASALRRKGVGQVAEFSIKMVENYPPFGGAPGEEKQKSRLAKAEDRIQETAKAIHAGASEKGGALGFLQGILGRIIYPVFLASLKKADRRFSATDACTNCGVCRRICPVGDIRLEEGRPVWLGHCEQCFACFHWCPEQAILYGKRSARQRRYHHPDASLQEMLE
jgi:ferredoxin